MALKNFVAAALFIGGASWLWVIGSQRVDAERRAIASQYSLGAQQLTAYDKCVGAMEHRALYAGGSKQQFCGCLTQKGLSDLQPDESNAVFGWIEHGIREPAMVTDGQHRFLRAAITCSEDTRSKWTSVAAMQSWCAEKDARRNLSQCKLTLK
jgi:hypothetical protein